MEIGHPSSAWLVGLLFAVSNPVWSAENFLSNPTTPYPPGCATNFPLVLEMPGKESDINSATVFMYEADDSSSQHEVAVRIWRRGCTESDRSLLFFEMSVIDDGDDVVEAVLCPEFEADQFGIVHKLRGVKEPNSWAANGQSQRVEEGQTVTLFLDGMSVYDDSFDESLVLTAEEYNADFDLRVLDPRTHTGFRVGIPEYRNQHLASELPLSGRLSGTWVVPGVPDQGFVLAFEELVHQSRLNLFLSWYTFDQDGAPMWLTGNALFDVGDTSIDFPIVFVQDGTFMGPQNGTRIDAGMGSLKAFGCNRLVLTYDLNNIGMGDGGFALQRIFSMETAGYACRDAQARIEALD